LLIPSLSVVGAVGQSEHSHDETTHVHLDVDPAHAQFHESTGIEHHCSDGGGGHTHDQKQLVNHEHCGGPPPLLIPTGSGHVSTAAVCAGSEVSWTPVAPPLVASPQGVMPELAPLVFHSRETTVLIV
jgi:hypothetical protein